MKDDFEAVCLPVGPLPTNCYVIKRKDSQDCLIVDPGPGAEVVTDRILSKGWGPAAILVTHGHSDHVDGLSSLQAALAEKTGSEVASYSAESEKAVFESPEENVSPMITGQAKTYTVDRWLSDGEEITLAGILVRTLYTPGHTRGGCSYYLPEAGVVFVGDTVFAGGVGRTDFPGGSMSDLIRSATEKILTLPDDTDLLPGHGDFTTVGREKEENPYLCY